MFQDLLSLEVLLGFTEATEVEQKLEPEELFFMSYGLYNLCITGSLLL